MNSARKVYRFKRRDPGLKAFLQAVCLQLQGQRVSEAKRSIGSALLINIGKISSYPGFHKPRRLGEWHLFVHMAPWAILRGDKQLLTCGDRSSVIDSKLASLVVGKTIKNVVVHRGGSLEIELDKKLRMIVFKTYQEEDDTNWCIFYRNQWWVANTANDDPFEIDVTGPRSKDTKAHPSPPARGTRLSQSLDSRLRGNERRLRKR